MSQASDERDAALAKAIKRMAARKRQASGAQAEVLIAQRLRLLGLSCVEKQATPMARIRGAWRHSAKVSGDFKAVAAGGRSVIVEVKLRARVLVYSDFEAHQVRALDQYVAAGGIALIAWRSDLGISIMRYPVPGFGPGCSLSPEAAAQLNLTEIR